MGKKSLLLLGFSILLVQVEMFSLGCNSKKGPSTPYDTAFTPTPTQVEHVYGDVNAKIFQQQQAAFRVARQEFPAR